MKRLETIIYHKSVTHWKEKSLHGIFVLHSPAQQIKQTHIHTYIIHTHKSMYCAICCRCRRNTAAVVASLRSDYYFCWTNLDWSKEEEKWREPMRETELKKGKKRRENCVDLWNRFNNSQSIYIYPIDCLAMFTLSSSNPYYALAVAFSSFSDRINNNGKVIFKGFLFAACE